MSTRHHAIRVKGVGPSLRFLKLIVHFEILPHETPPTILASAALNRDRHDALAVTVRAEKVVSIAYRTPHEVPIPAIGEDSLLAPVTRVVLSDRRVIETTAMCADCAGNDLEWRLVVLVAVNVP